MGFKHVYWIIVTNSRVFTPFNIYIASISLLFKTVINNFTNKVFLVH